MHDLHAFASCKYVFMHMCLYACVSEYIYACVCVCMCVNACTGRVCVCVCVCVCVHMYSWRGIAAFCLLATASY